MPNTAPPPFTHQVAVATLHGSTKIRLVADEATRKAIAKSFRIRAVDELIAFFELVVRNDGAVAITGEVSVKAQQACIVTLEPVPEAFVEPVDVLMAPPNVIAKMTKRAEEDEIPDFEPPDELVDGVIDLGALACEFLALGLEPFPRKDGAEFGQLEINAEPVSPFAALQSLKSDEK